MTQKNQLTDRGVRALKPKEKSYLVLDSESFFIRVSPKGKKTWYLIPTLNGKKKWYKLGTYPSLSLSEARERAKEARKLLDDNKCPREEKLRERREQDAAPTIRDLANEYLEEHAKKKKRSWKEDERILNVDVLPVLGDKKAHDIDQRVIVEFLDSIAARTTVHANRVLAVLRIMFNICIARGRVQNNPCLYLRRPQEEEPRTRHLSEKEIRAFWNGLDHAPLEESTRQGLRMILVTGQRPGEVAGMHWREIDDRWWTIPPERLKSGKRKNALPHRVYLNELAMEILGSHGDGFVFPSQRYKGEKPIAPNTLPHALFDHWRTIGLDTHCTAHDLRRTATTEMTKAGIPRLTASKVLNHAEGGVTSLYDLYKYDKEKAAALRLWGKRLKSLVAPNHEP